MLAIPEQVWKVIAAVEELYRSSRQPVSQKAVREHLRLDESEKGKVSVWVKAAFNRGLLDDKDPNPGRESQLIPKQALPMDYEVFPSPDRLAAEIEKRAKKPMAA